VRAWGLVVGAAILVAPVHTLAAPPRPYDGTRDVGWSDDGASDPTAASSRRDIATRPSVPRPVPPKGRATIRVAIGMSPAMPGSKHERDLLQRLERSSKQSPDPPAQVRRLRPGVGEARQICRERKDDLVVMLGYVADREDPVVLAHDCRLDVALPVRPASAVDEVALLGAFWDEHDELVRNGAKERRIAGKLSQGARAGIAAAVAIVVIGVAVGFLVANALRKEKVVLKVEP
jgi:nucleotide-binding universal stress UspA family protein